MSHTSIMLIITFLIAFCLFVVREMHQITEIVHLKKASQNSLRHLPTESVLSSFRNISVNQTFKNEEEASVLKSSSPKGYLLETDSGRIVSMSTNYTDMKDAIHVDVMTFYVVSLQGVPGVHSKNSARFETFLNVWLKHCNFSFHFCPGIRDADVKPGVRNRGYGITQAYVNCFNIALLSNDSISVFLEDDARLVNNKSCDIQRLNAQLKSRPSDTLLVLLGGHQWKFKNSHIINNHFRLSLFSSGAYGFVVSRQHLKTLQQWYIRDIQEGLRTNQHMLSPDASWYKLAKRKKLHVYAFWPNIVFHDAGYSNTWHKNRKRIGPQ